jgi:hypothetical protein
MALPEAMATMFFTFCSSRARRCVAWTTPGVWLRLCRGADSGPLGDSTPSAVQRCLRFGSYSEGLATISAHTQLALIFTRLPSRDGHIGPLSLHLLVRLNLRVVYLGAARLRRN